MKSITEMPPWYQACTKMSLPGTGTIYTFTIVRHPLHPDLEEACREAAAAERRARGLRATIRLADGVAGLGWGEVGVGSPIGGDGVLAGRALGEVGVGSPVDGDGPSGLLAQRLWPAFRASSCSTDRSADRAATLRSIWPAVKHWVRMKAVLMYFLQKLRMAWSVSTSQ